MSEHDSFEVELVRALAYRRIRERLIPLELAEKFAEGIAREHMAWKADHDRQVAEKAWSEGYALGMDDERTAEVLRVDIGVGGYATPGRQNPYRTTNGGEGGD